MVNLEEFDERLLAEGGMNEVETFYGLIESTMDALRIVELCRQGKLGRVSRRLHDKERKLIRSGSVFVFDEVESGIKRWTDGRIWSPSRILGNFLIYRELERKPAQQSEVAPTGEGFDEEEYRVNGEEWGLDPKDPELAGLLPWLTEPILQESEKEQGFEVLESKKLLTNHKGRYIFKPGGLIKKTISIRIGGHPHHLVCYYNKRDFCSSHLQNGKGQGQCSAFNHELIKSIREIALPEGMLAQQNFRKPINVAMGEAMADHPHPPCHDDTLIVKKPTPKRRSSFPGATPSIRPRRDHYGPYGFVPIAPALESSSSLGETQNFPLAMQIPELPAGMLNAAPNTPSSNIQFLYNEYSEEAQVSNAQPLELEIPASIGTQFTSDFPDENLQTNLYAAEPKIGLKWTTWLESPGNGYGFSNGNGLMGSPVLPPPDPMLASFRPPSALFETPPTDSTDSKF